MEPHVARLNVRLPVASSINRAPTPNLTMLEPRQRISLLRAAGEVASLRANLQLSGTGPARSLSCTTTTRSTSTIRPIIPIRPQGSAPTTGFRGIPRILLALQRPIIDPEPDRKTPD